MKRIVLKQFRIGQDMTQAEFGAAIGFGRDMVAKVEQGTKDGSTKYWVAIKQRFDVPDADMWRLMQTGKPE